MRKTSSFKTLYQWVKSKMSKPDPCTIDWKFIKSVEGSSKHGYVPCHPNGSVIGMSGVTVASGFDIGNQSVSKMTTYKLSPELLKKLLPYTDKKGEPAKAFLAKYPLILSDEEVDEVNEKVKGSFEKQVAALYDAYSDFKFHFLDTPKQTVIMSVAFQYGDLKRRCPRFFNMVTKGQWKQAVAELRNFGDDFPTRRNKEADLLESSLK